MANTDTEQTTDWTPSRLIEVFCREELRSSFSKAGRRQHSEWFAGFCSYAGRDAYGPDISGFDDGHDVWGALLNAGWTLIMDPGDRQFPYTFSMYWNPRLAPGGHTTAPGYEGKWCMMSYSEGDFGIEVFDDTAAYIAAEQKVRGS